MDKYEYKIKLDEMKSLCAVNDYESAAQIADTINWRKIKNINALVKAGEIYEKVGRYEESKEILLMAYDRSPIGRAIIYQLAEVAIKTKNFEEAKEYYDEFVEIAPHDNLKYVLKYEIQKAQGADISVLIDILEELKNQEYSEEWAFELAYLYHKAGMSEKCIEACDELILWFGDGVYVERALELKMLYQPLNKQQEEKYRQFRQKRDGIIEVRPEDTFESGEIVPEPIQIQDVKLSPERFNTQNLQEELQKSMQQIMEATEKGTVDDSMDTIKKLVEEIPYLQIPVEHQADEEMEEEYPHIETDAEIDSSISLNFQEMLGEEYDGQMQMHVPGGGVREPQVTGQMRIEDVLAEWEKTKRAAEAALQEAEQRKLESAKARALQEAGDIMERLADVIPKLDSGFTPKELLEEQYMAGESFEDDRAAAMVASMNQILQQEIDRLNDENAQMDEKIAAVSAVEIQSAAAMSEAVSNEIPQEISTEFPEESDETELYQEDTTALEAEDMDENLGLEEISVEEYMQVAEELVMAETVAAELEADPHNATMEDFAVELEEEAQRLATEMKEEEEILREEILPNIQMPEDLVEEVERASLPKIEEPEALEEEGVMKKLPKEYKEIFTYFVPIKGMEQQLCQAITGAGTHLMKGTNAATGNLIIQGGSGSGKTVLASSMIKALQQRTGKLTGKVGKIEASVLNQKDVAALLEKVAGGCLIIEKVGDISKETAVKLSLLLSQDSSGVMIIIEDTRKGIEKALSKDAGFAARFSEKITIPIFTSDELVAFAKAYANELGYKIDEMGVLALYNNISNIQKVDRETTLTEVKEIVDEAVAHVEKGVLKKAFSILTGGRYDENDYVILHEKDFNI